MKYRSISQQKKKEAWGADLVKSAMERTAARISEEVGAGSSVFVVQRQV